MKKITVLLLMATMFAYNTKAQKSGILQKDHYGDFTGDQWENFLAGKNATDFQAKSNVDLQPYLDIMVTPFVKQELKEKSITDAVGNSTVTTIPAGATVYTIQTDGTWKTRTAYIGKDGKGEKGFLHNPTGIFWLSFECGNLVNNKFFGEPAKQNVNGQTVAYTPPANTGGAPAGNTNNNYNVGGSGSQTNDQLLLGMKIRENDMLVDALIFKDIQKSTPSASTVISSNCNTCGSTGYSAPPNIYAAPMAYAAPSIAAAPQPAPNMYASNSSMNVTVRNKANGWDIANTVLNGANTFLNGVNTYRGVRLEQPRVAYSNMQSSYYGNTNPTGFQGSSILGQTYTSNQINTSNGNGGYSNTQIW